VSTADRCEGVGGQAEDSLHLRQRHPGLYVGRESLERPGQKAASPATSRSRRETAVPASRSRRLVHLTTSLPEGRDLRCPGARGQEKATGRTGSETQARNA